MVGSGLLIYKNSIYAKEAGRQAYCTNLRCDYDGVPLHLFRRRAPVHSTSPSKQPLVVASISPAGPIPSQSLLAPPHPHPIHPQQQHQAPSRFPCHHRSPPSSARASARNSAAPPAGTAARRIVRRTRPAAAPPPAAPPWARPAGASGSRGANASTAPGGTSAAGRRSGRLVA